MGLRVVFFITAMWMVSLVQGQKMYQLPKPDSRSYSIESWTTANGLPQNSINAIVQDSSGFIWCATNEGIVKFDGAGFNVMNGESEDRFVANRVESMEVDEHGAIWITSSEGYLMRIFKDSIKVIPIDMKDYGPIPLDIIPGEGPILMLDNRLLLYKGGHFDTLANVKTELDLHTYTIKYLNDKIFVTAYNDLLVYENGELKRSELSGIRETTAIPIVREARDGRYLISTDRYIFIYRGEELQTRLEIPQDANLSRKKANLLDSRGNLWVVCKDGIRVYEQDEKGDFKLKWFEDRLKSKDIQVIFEDQTGQIWLGSGDAGLAYLGPDLFSTFSLPGPYKNKSTNGVSLQGDSNLWMSISCQGIQSYNLETNEFTIFDAEVLGIETVFECAFSVAVDSNQNVWATSFGGGVVKVSPGGNVTHYSHEDVHLKPTNLSLYVSRENDLLIGNRFGVDRYDRSLDSFVEAFPDIEIPKVGVHHIYEDRKGRWWFCTRQGILMKEGDQLHHFSKANGDLKSNIFRYCFEDSNDQLWFGSYGGGLYYYNEDEFISVPITDATQSQAVSWIGEYGGKLWVTTNRGLLASDYGQLMEFVEGHRNSFDIIRFGDQEGLEFDEFNGGFQSAGFIHEDKFYLPSVSGPVVFDPQRVSTAPPPSIMVEDIFIDGEPVEFQEQLRLPANYRRLDLDVGFPVFFNRQNYRVEYKLEGLDEEWVPFDPSSPLSFTRLKAKNYNLKMRARSLVSGEQITHQMKIEVLPPFYLKWEFQILLGLAIALLTFYLFRRFLKKRREREIELQNLVEERTAELLRSRSNITAIIENTDDLVFSVDLDLRLIYANKNYLRVFKEQTNKDLKRNECPLNYLHPHAGKYWRQLFHRALAGESFSVISDKVVSSDEGRFAISEVFFNSFKDPNGNVQGVVVFISDVTRSIRQKEELEKAREEALEASRSKSEFLATMSHEIRTPMNGVIGMTSLLAETPLNNDQKEYVQTLRVSADMLMTIINEVLDYSKIMSGKLEMEERVFDPESIINETLRIMGNKASGKNLQLLYSVSPDVPQQIISDPSRLRQVLVNLVANAVKFTERGWVHIHLDCLETQEKKCQLRFQVHDTGIGIPKEKQNRLFKPFNQVDSSTTRKYGGTGLGLAICKEVVQRMNGDIGLESEAGEGANFIFTIQAPIKGATTIQDRYAQFQNVEFLLIDPILKSRNVLQSFLQSMGAKVLISDSIPGCEDYGQLSVILINNWQITRKEAQALSACKSSFIPPPIVVNVQTPAVPSLQHRMPGVIDRELHSPVEYPKLLRVVKGNQESTGIKARPENEEEIDWNPAILLVEDNEVNRRLAQRFLSKLEMEIVDIAENGREAVQKVMEKSYDIVLMDVQMPVMDGFEATREIRKSQPDRPLIIAMTANALEGDRDKCIRAGMDDYLSKPVKLNQLRASFQKWKQIIEGSAPSTLDEGAGEE